MFGDFFQNFGLQFPFAGLDQQGGLFAAFQAPEPSAQPQPGMENKSPSPPGPQAAAAPQPKPSPGGSPLASPLSPQAATLQQPQPPGSAALQGNTQLAQNDIPTIRMTPAIEARFNRRVQNAGSDEELNRIVGQVSKKYGVDWSHLLRGSEYEK